MPNAQTTRLRETSEAAPASARVIDTSFEIVGRKRGVLAHIWTTCVAIFWAAVIGFLIPPAWLIAERLLSN
jgi:hypothetical protein